MPWRPTSRPSTPAGQGYGPAHRRRVAAAIAAEPWCHRRGGCPHADAGTKANPFTGDHPLPLARFGGDRIAWSAQPLVVLCRRCNTSKAGTEA